MNQTHKKHHQKAVCVFGMEKNNPSKPQIFSSFKLDLIISMLIPLLVLFVVSLFNTICETSEIKVHYLQLHISSLFEFIVISQVYYLNISLYAVLYFTEFILNIYLHLH